MDEVDMEDSKHTLSRNNIAEFLIITLNFL